LVRLGPRRSPLVLRAGLDVELARGGARVRPLDVTLVRSRGATLTDAVELAGAEGAALASLVDARAGWGAGIFWQPIRAGVRALRGRGLGGPLGVGRWVLAVLESYRIVVAYAKLWERRRDRPLVMAG